MNRYLQLRGAEIMGMVKTSRRGGFLGALRNAVSPPPPPRHRVGRAALLGLGGAAAAVPAAAYATGRVMDFTPEQMGEGLQAAGRDFGRSLADLADFGLRDAPMAHPESDRRKNLRDRWQADADIKWMEMADREAARRQEAQDAEDNMNRIRHGAGTPFGLLNPVVRGADQSLAQMVNEASSVSRAAADARRAEERARMDAHQGVEPSFMEDLGHGTGSALKTLRGAGSALIEAGDNLGSKLNIW